MKYTILNENYFIKLFGDKTLFDTGSVSGIMPVFESVDEFVEYKGVAQKEEFGKKVKNRTEGMAQILGIKPEDLDLCFTAKIRQDLKKEMDDSIAEKKLEMLENAVNNNEQTDDVIIVASRCPDLANPYNSFPVVHALTTNLELSKQIANEIDKRKIGLFYKGSVGFYVENVRDNLFSSDLAIYDKQGKVLSHSKQYYRQHPEEMPKENEK